MKYHETCQIKLILLIELVHKKYLDTLQSWEKYNKNYYLGNIAKNILLKPEMTISQIVFSD